MAIRIITDSTCDIELEEQERLGIDIVPLTVSFGEDQYLDRVEIIRCRPLRRPIRTAS